MRCKDISYQLIRNVIPLVSRQLTKVKCFLEIPVSLDEFYTLDLKMPLGEFGLEERVSELHIDFGTFNCLIQQRNAWHESKFGEASGFETEHSADFPSPCNSGVAKNVHQQGV